jgi:hypothetical protein
MSVPDLDRLPTSREPSGPCHRCGRSSNFRRTARTPVTFTQLEPVPSLGIRPSTEQVVVLECAGCGQCTVVIERTVAGPDGRTCDEGIHWWPAPGAGDLDPDVPETVGSAFAEGMRALSANCPRAAVVMLRGMLAAVVCDQGSQDARRASMLHGQLKAMEQEGTLHPSLVEWATEIRLVGNAGARFDELEPVEQAEAADLARLCRHLITVVYETPARIRRARRSQPSR